MNELKLTQVELLLFSRFKCVAANVFESFCMAHLANNEQFYHSNLSFYVLILYAYKPASLS